LVDISYGNAQTVMSKLARKRKVKRTTIAGRVIYSR